MRTRGIALVAGLGLAFGVAAPAAAQIDDEALAADVLAEIPESGLSATIDEVFENLGLRAEEGEFVDNTPFNPVDDAGSIEFVDDVTFASEEG